MPSLVLHKYIASFCQCLAACDLGCSYPNDSSTPLCKQSIMRPLINKPCNVGGSFSESRSGRFQVTIHSALRKTQVCSFPSPCSLSPHVSPDITKTKTARRKQDQVNRNMFRNSGVYVLWSLWRKNLYGQAPPRHYFLAWRGHLFLLRLAVLTMWLGLFHIHKFMQLFSQCSTTECEAIKNKPSSYFTCWIMPSRFEDDWTYNCSIYWQGSRSIWDL